MWLLLQITKHFKFLDSYRFWDLRDPELILLTEDYFSRVYLHRRRVSLQHGYTIPGPRCGSQQSRAWQHVQGSSDITCTHGPLPAMYEAGAVSLALAEPSPDHLRRADLCGGQTTVVGPWRRPGFLRGNQGGKYKHLLFYFSITLTSLITQKILDYIWSILKQQFQDRISFHSKILEWLSPTDEDFKKHTYSHLDSLL